MSTIFFDESGYTGEDLMNPDQPFFTLASLCLSESDCKGLRERFFKNVKSLELRYKKLVKNPRQRGMIIDFLNELSNTPELVKILIVHKRYELVKKLVYYVIAPAAKKDGFDLRINGYDLALTYFIYHDLPALVRYEFVEDLLKRFQQMMIDKSHQSYHLFFDPLFEGYPQVSDKEHQKLIDFILWHIKKGHTTVGYDLIDHLEAADQSLRISHSRPLDIALQSALTLTENWRTQVDDEIIIIHDASSRMAEVFPLWETFVHPHPPPVLSQLKANNTASQIGVAATYLLNSKNSIGLQLTDIIAGATMWWIKWGEKGANPADEYGVALNSIMQSFTKFSHWPLTNPTLEDFEKRGMTEEEAQLQDQYYEKLAAFHRIRAYGYSYQVDFNK